MPLLMQHLSIIQVMLLLQVIFLVVLVVQNHDKKKLLESIDQSLKYLPAVSQGRGASQQSGRRVA